MNICKTSDKASYMLQSSFCQILPGAGDPILDFGFGLSLAEGAENLPGARADM